MASEQLYDEFGNYIGPDASSSEEEEDSDAVGEVVHHQHGDVHEATQDDEEEDRDVQVGPSAIVLQEDKQYYPEADELYPGAEVLVQMEDTQDVSEPILKPSKVATFAKKSGNAPDLRYNLEFLSVLMARPSLVRNVAVLGSLHHGKTLLCDLLIQHTFADIKATERRESEPPRFCDTRHDERARGISIKSCPTSLALEDGRGKTYVVNVLDCPGHANFQDEVVAALQCADAAVIVVDVVEGAMMMTKKSVKYALDHGIPIMLCLNKMDRLIHELKLSPSDAYLKMVFVVDQVNKMIGEHPMCTTVQQQQLSPLNGNVCFASGGDGWLFTLESFARLHLGQQGLTGKVNAGAFSKKLWGNQYYDPRKRKFQNESVKKSKRSFVAFILNPIYKIYAQVLGEEPDQIKRTMEALKIPVSQSEVLLDPSPLLRIVLSRFFRSQGVSGFVDMIVKNVPRPGSKENQPKLSNLYTGPLNDDVFPFISSCDADGLLRVYVSKLYATHDAKSFQAFGKVYCGTLQAGQKLRVLGSEFSQDDQEDMSVVKIARLKLCQAGHDIAVDKVGAGNWVLIEGIGDAIRKCGTLVLEEEPLEQLYIFKPLQFDDFPVVKLAIEPLHPAELPQMLHGLRCVGQSYPLMATKVEESGEHVLFGTGELYVDCVMHDLREMFSGIEIKVTDPMTPFCETVVETSSIQTFAETPNYRNKLSFIAEPLEKGLGIDAEAGRLLQNSSVDTSQYLMEKYGWDKLAVKSLWAFGPTTTGPNVIFDDTIPGDVDKDLLRTVRESIIQGFRWATREGPLCDEPMRDVKFRILDAQVASEQIHRGAGLVIPMARRVAFSSFLTATPRLMEPIYKVEVQAPIEMSEAIHRQIRNRRGHIVGDSPVPGSPFNLFQGWIPVMESFGFETDLRIFTRGRAFPQTTFSHWELVPGDPLEDTAILRPLEKSRNRDLARDFAIKTRRRKGLPEGISIVKYFDDPQLLQAYQDSQRREKLSNLDNDESGSNSSSSDDSSESSNE